MKITYDTIPTALEYLIQKVESLESRLAMNQVQQPTEPPPEVLNQQQALELLNRNGVFIKKSSLYKGTHYGKIPHRKISGRLVFDRTELMEWINTLSQDQAKINTNQAVVKSAIKKIH